MVEIKEEERIDMFAEAELNPRERDLFVSVANELIENGYFTYEETNLQSY